jgi:hypothetical protein
MDWGGALDAFGSYKDKEFEKAIEKLSAQEGARRSARTKGCNERIQSMAKAIKKKKNEPSGNTHPFPVLASQLTTVAAACNISLGNSPIQIDASISSFHANERAMAALQAARKKVSNTADNTMIEVAHEGETNNFAISERVEIERPPKKPPTRGHSRSSQLEKVASSRTKEK